MLYESTVNTVSDYGSEIRGYVSMDAINKVHVRAAMTFLGLPKQTINVGVMAEISWALPRYGAR